MATEYTESYDTFLKDTLPELPGAIRSVALRELRLTLREFFEKSYAWTKTVTGVAAVAGENGIQITDGDNNTEVIALLHAAYGSNSEGFIDLGNLAERPTKYETGSSPTHWYVSSNPDELVLYPYLDAVPSKTLTVKVALIPDFAIDPNADTLPRQVVLKYYDAICEGFLARMYGQPNKPYSAPVLGQQKRHNFLRAIGFYAAQRKQGYNQSQNWQFPRGWRISRTR
jgi:hypothetical protein